MLSYALSIIEDPEEQNLLFLGTDDGLYISINAGTSWKKWTHGFPTVSVKDLVIQEREHDLVIGTFGRAAWVLDDIRPLRAISKNNEILASDIKVFDSPVAYQVSYQQPTGSRFGADAIFNGENRVYGARIMYYFQNASTDSVSKNEDKVDKEDEDSKDDVSENSKGKHKDSLYLKIYDGDRLIRSLKRKIPDSTGIYRWRWYMKEAGVDRPSRKIEKHKNEPGGVSVKPGTYRVEISYLEQLSKGSITIKNDPRVVFSEKGINEAYQTVCNKEKRNEYDMKSPHGKNYNPNSSAKLSADC